MPKIVKWGFGLAPFKPETLKKYTSALMRVNAFVKHGRMISPMDLAENISEVKGLFNRIYKEDQWDWFTVNMYFDYPRIEEVKMFVSNLANMRRAVLNGDSIAIEKLKAILLRSNFLKYMTIFFNFNKDENEDQYIYILSRREDRELLKIGRTGRNIEARVKEINASTGVLYPLSPRRVFRVTDCKVAEQLIHNRLDDFRVRSDREFFIIDFKKALPLINDCLIQNNLYHYKYDISSYNNASHDTRRTLRNTEVPQ